MTGECLCLKKKIATLNVLGGEWTENSQALSQMWRTNTSQLLNRQGEAGPAEVDGQGGLNPVECLWWLHAWLAQMGC